MPIAKNNQTLEEVFNIFAKNFNKIKENQSYEFEVRFGTKKIKTISQIDFYNVISSIIMTQLGFVRDGLMINLVPSNKKLRKRKITINNYFKNKKK